MYDRYIRRFQSHAEREAAARRKGQSGMLEAGLHLGEARQQVREEVPFRSNLSMVESRAAAGEISTSATSQPARLWETNEIPDSKEEGWAMWKHEMTMRFLRGEDVDFDYGSVDVSAELDDCEDREKEEEWFDNEEPEWASADTQDGASEGLPAASGAGETGIQDF